RTPDDAQFGYKNPLDQIDAHQGLKALADATGGISILNKNNFNEGLAKIVSASDGYYLLAYTPYDTNFKGDFRKEESKVKGDGLKVYSRRGYFAREEKPAPPPEGKKEQLLAAIKSPLARRDINFDAMVLYKAAQQTQGGVDIHLSIDPAKLQLEQVNDGRKA